MKRLIILAIMIMIGSIAYSDSADPVGDAKLKAAIEKIIDDNNRKKPKPKVYPNITKNYVNGDVYVGTIIEGDFNGFGTFIYASGEKYVGEFKDGTLHGIGIDYYPNGEIYIGRFKEGKRDGYGTLYSPDGSVIYSGKWRDDGEDGSDK